LLPPGTRADEVRALFDDLQAAASSLGVSLVGGHTEVTAAVTQPVIAATMLGLAERDDVITGEGIVPGDAVLLAGKIAIEGTALLARDCASALRERGVPEATIAAAASMLDDPGISVVPAARTIREATHPRLLHDPTEGGIATALMELAHSARATLRIDAGAIPVRAETRTVCDTLELDPLGLLASGALLAIIERGSTDAVIAALTGAGVPAGVIGRVESGGPEVIMASDDRASPGAVPFPRFERDELARYLEGASVSRVQPEGPS
jgi:hydrogenase maturation factor